MQLPDHIAALYAKPQSQWTASDWSTLAGEFYARWQAALDGHNEANEVAEAAQRRADEYAAALERALVFVGILRAEIDRLAEAGTQAKHKARGRPIKHNDRSYRWLLEWFNKAKTEFVAANTGKRPTDEEVMRWYFGREINKDPTKRPSRANSINFKNLKNLLGKARKLP